MPSQGYRFNEKLFGILAGKIVLTRPLFTREKGALSMKLLKKNYVLHLSKFIYEQLSQLNYLWWRKINEMTVVMFKGVTVRIL